MKKKGNPGCPCCTSPPPGDCDCDTTIRIDIYDADDTAVVFQINGFGGDPPDYQCCSQSVSGLSAIEGTYFLDVSGTPDYSDANYDYYILRTVPANENPLNPQNLGDCDLLAIGPYYCIWLRAIYRKSKVENTCDGNVVFQLLQHTQDALPPSPYDPCDIDEAIVTSESLMTGGDLSYCMNFTGLAGELTTIGYTGQPVWPCPPYRYWTTKYDITNPV